MYPQNVIEKRTKVSDFPTQKKDTSESSEIKSIILTAITDIVYNSRF